MSLLFLFSYFYSDGSNQHIIWAAGGKSVFIWEAGWEQAISMERHDPKELVLLIALKIMRHAKLCLSVMVFLICVLII